MSLLATYWLELLGWGGSALLVYSLLQRRVLRFRILNLLGGTVLMTFNALMGVWPMVALNLVTSLINIHFILRLRREAHDEAAYEIFEVGGDDAYLRHILSSHASEIRKLQPTFTGEVLPGEEAFIIVKGDETVGVVVISRDGTIARVMLDYVTPAFRDFTPGEFVWRRSDLLTRRGYRHVMTHPAQINPYYEEIGFRRNGNTWLLDLDRRDRTDLVPAA